MIYISLVESEQANIAIEHDDLFSAIKTANSMIDAKDYGNIHAAQVFKTEKVLMGAEEIKSQGQLVVSLRTFR